MSTRFEMYKCTKDDCDMVIEVLNPCSVCDDDSLSACGNPMKKLEEKTADAANEKHVPVIESIDGGFKVKVGSVPHPMEEDHWIQWIELHSECGSVVLRKFLNPGDAPEAVFKTDLSGDVSAREHCNKHGLWKG